RCIEGRKGFMRVIVLKSDVGPTRECRWEELRLFQIAGVRWMECGSMNYYARILYGCWGFMSCLEWVADRAKDIRVLMSSLWVAVEESGLLECLDVGEAIPMEKLLKMRNGSRGHSDCHPLLEFS
ncbi:hypothetical protein FOZ62_014131, partial [Perkinsus olseni]